MASFRIPSEENLSHGTEVYVGTPCKGCQHWSEESVQRVKKEIKEKWGILPEISEDKPKQLKVTLIDQSRLTGGDSKIVVAMCSPDRSF